MDLNKRLHWYCFTFQGKFLGDDRLCTTSTYAGYKMKDTFTLSEIGKQKANALVQNTATLISITYLGHMTKEEFTN